VRLVITDLQMAGMDGFTLVKTLRAEEVGAAERTAVVVCSGQLVPALHGAETDGPPLDCDSFLLKPVSLDTLHDCLQALGLGAAEAATG
jgi:CheY-like chemotaxis protein